MRKRIAAGLLAFALAFTAMDFGGLVSIQANAAGLVQVTEENQSNFHLNGDYAGYYAIADKEAYEKQYQVFCKLLKASRKGVPLSEIIDCIERIVVDVDRKIMVKWTE